MCFCHRVAIRSYPATAEYVSVQVMPEVKSESANKNLNRMPKRLHDYATLKMQSQERGCLGNIWCGIFDSGYALYESRLIWQTYHTIYR